MIFGPLLCCLEIQKIAQSGHTGWRILLHLIPITQGVTFVHTKLYLNRSVMWYKRIPGLAIMGPLW